MSTEDPSAQSDSAQSDSTLSDSARLDRAQSDPTQSGSPRTRPQDIREVRTTRIVAGKPVSGSPKRPGSRTSGRRSTATKLLVASGLAIALVAGVSVAAVALSHGPDQPAVASDQPADVRLGYFANVTHAVPLVGVNKGIYREELGSSKLTTQIFNAGPAAVEALNAGAIDAAYLGPNPAINSYVKSKGASISIVAGSASGGAQLVVRNSIRSAQDLRGKTLATPQLGGTQDVALRVWLADHGLKVATTGGNDVTINPSDNAQTLKLFQQGKIDGAWLPEPWASRLVLQAHGSVLVDEKDLWKGGAFPTTILIVNKTFLRDHPSTVLKLLKAQQKSQEFLAQNRQQSVAAINDALKQVAGAPLPDDVLQRSLANLTFTLDPQTSAYPKLLDDGVKAGVTQKADLGGIFDLTLLNRLLSESGRPTLSAASALRESEEGVAAW